MITSEEVRKIAQLAHLEITDEEVEKYTPQMVSIVAYVEQLNELDTAEIELSTGGMTTQINAARPDEIRPSLGQSNALKEAPDAASGHFRVPKVL